MRITSWGKNMDWTPVIKGCVSNNRKSQEKLYRHFFPIMEIMIRKHTRDEDQIMDILNNSFLKVFKKIDTYQFQGSFEGWIRKIVYHSMCDYFRKSAKDIRFLVFENQEYDIKVKPNHKLYFQDLLNMINKLPEKHHKVFYMFAIEGYKHEEIANTMQLNVNTSKWYLSEARKKLKKIYKEEMKIYYSAKK